MQDATLSESLFRDEYHRALKNITKDSENILGILSKAADICGTTSRSDTDDVLPSIVKMPKSKKM